MAEPEGKTMNKITLVNSEGKTATVGDNPVILDAYGQRGFRPLEDVLADEAQDQVRD